MATRKEIRDALRDALLDQIPSVGQNVFSNRLDAYFKGDLPAISIYTRQESAQPRDVKALQYIRKMELVVEITAQVDNEATTSIDDELDSLSEAVEDIIFQDPSLGGTAMGCVLQTTEIELSGEPSSPVGVLTLVFEISYIR